VAVTLFVKNSVPNITQ